VGGPLIKGQRIEGYRLCGGNEGGVGKKSEGAIIGVPKWANRGGESFLIKMDT